MRLSKQQKTMCKKRLDSSKIHFYPYYAYNLKSSRILIYFVIKSKAMTYLSHFKTVPYYPMERFSFRSIRSLRTSICWRRHWGR